MPRGWDTRRFQRVPFESPAVLRIHRSHRKKVNLVEKNVNSTVLNLSEGGCGIETKFFIPKGTRVNIFIDRKTLSKEGKEDKGTTRIMGCVMNCLGKDLRKYRLGFEFIRMTPTDRKLISEMVKFLKRKE